jgi:hypothetical protein
VAYTRLSVGSRLDMGRSLLEPVPEAGMETRTRPFEMLTSYLWRGVAALEGEGDWGGGGRLDETVHGWSIENVAWQ